MINFLWRWWSSDWLFWEMIWCTNLGKTSRLLGSAAILIGQRPFSLSESLRESLTGGSSGIDKGFALRTHLQSFWCQKKSLLMSFEAETTSLVGHKQFSHHESTNRSFIAFFDRGWLKRYFAFKYVSYWIPTTTYPMGITHVYNFGNFCIKRFLYWQDLYWLDTDIARSTFAVHFATALI